MKKTIIISAVAVALMISACNNSSRNYEAAKSETTSQTFNIDTTKLNSGEKFYLCEMHPDVISDKAGNCPKCGMELSEMKKQ